MLTARHLSRRHPNGERWLLDDLSFELSPGERVGLRGPSGSGKTLLLRSLALLDPLDRGEVLRDGQRIQGTLVPEHRRQVLYCHQRPVLVGPTVDASLRQPFGLGVHRDRRFDRKRAVRWLQDLGRPEEFLDATTSRLSGGESQLVALIRTLQLEPRVLLLDEPTAALDIETTRTAETLLQRWLDDRPEAAMIWVGHDPAQLDRMTQRSVHMRSGCLEEPG